MHLSFLSDCEGHVVALHILKWMKTASREFDFPGNQQNSQHFLSAALPILHYKQTNNDNKIRSQTPDCTKPWAFILFPSKQMLGSFHSPPFFLTFQAHSACLKHEGQKRERQIIATSTLRPLGTQRILHSSQQNVSAGNYTIMLQSYKHLFAVLTLLP